MLPQIAFFWTFYESDSAFIVKNFTETPWEIVVDKSCWLYDSDCCIGLRSSAEQINGVVSSVTPLFVQSACTHEKELWVWGGLQEGFPVSGFCKSMLLVTTALGFGLHAVCHLRPEVLLLILVVWNHFYDRGFKLGESLYPPPQSWCISEVCTTIWCCHSLLSNICTCIL